MREHFEQRTVVRGEDEQKSTSRQPKRGFVFVRGLFQERTNKTGKQNNTRTTNKYEQQQ
jgi:hypothetical protein